MGSLGTFVGGKHSALGGNSRVQSGLVRRTALELVSDESVVVGRKPFACNAQIARRRWRPSTEGLAWGVAPSQAQYRHSLGCFTSHRMPDQRTTASSTAVLLKAHQQRRAAHPQSYIITKVQ